MPRIDLHCTACCERSWPDCGGELPYAAGHPSGPPGGSAPPDSSQACAYTVMCTFRLCRKRLLPIVHGLPKVSHGIRGQHERPQSLRAGTWICSKSERQRTPTEAPLLARLPCSKANTSKKAVIGGSTGLARIAARESVDR